MTHTRRVGHIQDRKIPNPPSIMWTLRTLRHALISCFPKNMVFVQKGCEKGQKEVLNFLKARVRTRIALTAE